MPFADPLFEEFFRDFFDTRPQRSTRTSLGSGVIVRADGTIVTNEHVILRGGRIHVTLADGREFEAKLVGRDPDSDLAVLRIDTGRPLPFVALGKADDLMIGETVIAIGNPFGLSHTVTTGVVSALKRSLRTGGRTYTDFIQTDASINPGNSGGPLLNILGELIGINSAIYGSAQGIGFAIPVDRARRVLGDLTSGKRAVEPDPGQLAWSILGIQVRDVREATAGLLVTRVREGGVAERLGIEKGDVVLGVNGEAVGSVATLGNKLDTARQEGGVVLSIGRGGRRYDVEVPLGPGT
jgi:serine protease Do